MWPLRVDISRPDMSSFLRRLGLVLVAFGPIGPAHAAPPVPLASGEYRFLMKDVEFPNLSGTPIRIVVSGRHVKIVSDSLDSTAFPLGSIVDEGTIIWHSATGQWIVGNKESDGDAAEVGGCSEGPAVIDFVGNVYWWC